MIKLASTTFAIAAALGGAYWAFTIEERPAEQKLVAGLRSTTDAPVPVDKLTTGSVATQTPAVRSARKPAPSLFAPQTGAVPSQQISTVAAMCTTELGKRKMISKNGKVPVDVCTCIAEGLAQDLQWPDFYYAGVLLNHGLRNSDKSPEEQKPQIFQIYKAAKSKGLDKARFDAAYTSVGRQINACS